MNPIQRKSTAKFLYDIAKIILAVAAINNIFSKQQFDLIALIMGTFATGSIFSFGYFLERKVDHE